MKKYEIIVVIVIICISTGILLCNDKNNKNDIKIHTAKGIIDMETYMCNVILNEMNDYDNYEALKAFCVIIRSNIICKLIDSKENVVNEKDLGVRYDYKLKNKRQTLLYDNIVKAINDTKGEILVYKDTSINIPYHKISSGRTNNYIKKLNVRVPYLNEKDCDKDIESEDYLKIKYFANKDKTLGDIIKKELDNAIYNYDIDKTQNGYRVVFYGYGHGYGLSLYNANNLGKEGYSYKQILDEFYKNTKLVRVY